VLGVNPGDVAAFDTAGGDAHGHVHIDDVNLGEILKTEVSKRLKEIGIKTTITAKNIGYELRCADPIPFDMEYTRDLGYSAAEYLISDRGAVMVSMQGGRFVPIPFAELIDPETGRTRVRAVDVKSTRYAIARSYMLRLSPSDFKNAGDLARLASIAHLGGEGWDASGEGR
jgi:6-phosphofructokinase 1